MPERTDTRCWAGWLAFYGGRWPAGDPCRRTAWHVLSIGPGADVVAAFCDVHMGRLIADGMISQPRAGLTQLDADGVDRLNAGKKVRPVDAVYRAPETTNGETK